MSRRFLDLIHLSEAVDLLLAGLPPGPRATETVALGEVAGRVLASDVVAPRDLPGFDRSTMDGYAVRAADTFGAGESLPAYMPVTGEVPMGSAPGVSVGPGAAARISTGGFMPDGADAVVMVENTQAVGDTIEVLRAVAPGENVLRRDEDVAAGSVLLRRGSTLGPAQLGVCAGLGMGRIEVYPVPVVGVISTGDEVVDWRSEPGPGQVRDVNSPALAAAVERAGCTAKEYGIVADEKGKLLEASRRALRECDALLVSGGSSAGVRDLTVEVLGELGRPGVLAHGIYLKPGKPTLVAICDGKPVLGLPGNPASALAVFREIGLPLLRRLRGEEPGPGVNPYRRVRAAMGRPVSSETGRTELVPVDLEEGEEGLIAVPIMGRSSLIGTLARARGQVRIPEGSEGLERGEEVTVELLD
ncbi:MAG: gephyrin-like molybdotransferase Glp [Actinomycetota bacterium]